MLFDISVDKNLAAKVMEGVEFIESEADLLKSFGIWDETCSQIFSLISEHTAMCTTGMDSDNDYNINIDSSLYLSKLLGQANRTEMNSED